MLKFRAFVALAIVCALAPVAAAEVQLRRSSVISCSDCYGRYWADFNGDRLDDFLFENQLHLNLGGRLAAPISLPDVRAEQDTIRHVADFNGDGFADLLLRPTTTLNESGNYEEPEPLRLLVGDGAGRFTERPMPEGTDVYEILQIADYTGDGKLDLMRWNHTSKDLEILRGNGDATFTQHQLLVWPFANARYDGFAPADVNGDGRLDIVAPYHEYLHIYFARPNGQFGDLETRFTRLKLVNAKFADVNGDAKADLVFNDVHFGEGGVTALFGDGTGRFPGVSRYAVPRPTNGTDIDRASATEIQVADFVAGGANEIAFGQQGDGYVSILGVANGQLVELARQDVEAKHPTVHVVRFTANKPQIMALGQWSDESAPRGSRLRYTNWFIEPEGVVTAAATRGRRGRAIGRNGFTGGRYHVSIDGDCAPKSVRNWSLEREGLFVNVERAGAIEHAESVFLDGEVFMRILIKDGAATRTLEGTLNITELGLSGKLFEVGENPCGGRWQMHHVVAELSH